MGNSISGPRIVIQLPFCRSVARDMREQNELDAITAELLAAHVRIEALREGNGELTQRHDTLNQEFQQRLVNGLQVIERLLPRQSQTAAPEAAMRQLTVAICAWIRAGRSPGRFH
jgi:hypothetical protein